MLSHPSSRARPSAELPTPSTATPDPAPGPAGPLSPQLWLTLAAACAVAMLSFGVRTAFGLFTDPLPRELGLGRESYATAMAIQNLCWGLVQPFAGYLSDRFGARRVMLAGAFAFTAGILGTAQAQTVLELHLTAGVLVGVGMGGASFTTAVAVLGRAMPLSHRAWAAGLATAAGSFGQFAIVPLAQAVIDTSGWRASVLTLAALGALIVLLAPLVRGDQAAAAADAASSPPMPMRRVLAQALAQPGYLMLVIGFFGCGFQLAFITNHLAPYLRDSGLAPATAAWALALVGLFNIAGCYLAGLLSARPGKPRMLGHIYLARAACLALFIALPVSVPSVLVFGATMGLLWLSTVPPTSGLISAFFGVRYLSTLFGVAFFSHQLGSFCGAYFGGVLFASTGSYALVWQACVGLSLAAAVLNYAITERPLGRPDALAA